jgi:16S rRNA G966 N2-methylase RsmD
MINLKEEHSKFVKLYSFSSGATSPTNRKLTEEMISHLDEEIFKNPNSKFLDPCAGTGTFGVVLHDRLLKYHDSKWIFEKMIFMVDTSRVNCDLLKKLGFVNVYNDDFLNLKLDMKFDVIVGNPPFQKSLKSGKKSVDTLWAKFIQKSFEIVEYNGTVSLICPDGWCSPTFDIPSGEISIFRDYFKINNLKYVATNNKVKPYFKNIGTFFSYFVCEKNNYKNKTIFNDGFIDVEFDISSFDFIPKKIDSVSLSIHEKILNGGDKFIFERYRSKDGGMLDERHPHFFTPKLKFSRGLAKFNVSGDNGTSGYDVFTYAYHLQNDETIESGLSVLNSKVYKFVLNQKWNQYFTKYIPNMVKKPKLNKVYSDSMIYKFLKLTQEEIDYIENYVG